MQKLSEENRVRFESQIYKLFSRERIKTDKPSSDLLEKKSTSRKLADDKDISLLLLVQCFFSNIVECKDSGQMSYKRKVLFDTKRINFQLKEA